MVRKKGNYYLSPLHKWNTKNGAMVGSALGLVSSGMMSLVPEVEQLSLEQILAITTVNTSLTSLVFGFGGYVNQKIINPFTVYMSRAFEKKLKYLEGNNLPQESTNHIN